MSKVRSVSTAGVGLVVRAVQIKVTFEPECARAAPRSGISAYQV